MYKHIELDFSSLRKVNTDFKKIKEFSYFNTIAKITRKDDDKEGDKYYTLLSAKNILQCDDYIIMYSFSRGWDCYGYEYACSLKELREFLDDNKNNNNPFINAIKSYLGNEDGVEYHKYGQI